MKSALLEAVRSAPLSRIRNFAVIAHVDHGKTYLSERLMETCGTGSAVEHSRAGSTLDSLDVERSRGITVKARTASMFFEGHLLNLIDTPGHVDFSGEVSRSLRACEGALLLVDASQGVEAQTMAHFQSARAAGIPVSSMIPVLTKLDLPTADPEMALRQMEEVFGVDGEAAIWTSAKDGWGVSDVLDAIVTRIPSPVPSHADGTGGLGGVEQLLQAPASETEAGRGDSAAHRVGVEHSEVSRREGGGVGVEVGGLEGERGGSLDADLSRSSSTSIAGSGVVSKVGTAALLYDSWFDQYRGVVGVVSVREGELRRGMRLRSCLTRASYVVQEVGVLTGVEEVGVEALPAGRVGYVVCGMKEAAEAKIGDILATEAAVVAMEERGGVVEGPEEQRPVVFSSLFPADGASFEELSRAISRLQLTDASVTAEREVVPSLGTGFRCGFLGLLHLDVFEQRLEEEYGIAVLSTAPSIRYAILRRPHSPVSTTTSTTTSSTSSTSPTSLLDSLPPSAEVISRADEFPPSHEVAQVFEPMIEATVSVPPSHLSSAMATLHAARGEQTDVTTLSESRLLLRYLVPFQELVLGLVDKLKSSTSGYAAFDYNASGWRPTSVDLVRIRVNGSEIAPLAFLAHADHAIPRAKTALETLRKHIPRQQFDVALQALRGKRVIAKARVPAYRKDVLTKAGKTVGGGDKSRKQKLLAKQKAGKHRMRSLGTVNIPDKAFKAILGRNKH